MSVRLHALKSFAGNPGEGRIKKQRDFEVADDRRADELVRHGLARHLDAKAETGAPNNRMEAPPANKGEPIDLKSGSGAVNETRPLSLAGGATGRATPPSSSRRGRQQRAPDSTPPEGGQDS